MALNQKRELLHDFFQVCRIELFLLLLFRSAVHISVVDINEYSPVFLQPSYVTEVDEGRLYQEIIRVEATDKDCTPLFGDVCKYEILTLDQPFTIGEFVDVLVVIRREIYC